MFGKLLTFLRDHRSKHNYYNFSSDVQHLTSQDLTTFACQIAKGCDYLQGHGVCVDYIILINNNYYDILLYILKR